MLLTLPSQLAVSCTKKELEGDLDIPDLRNLDLSLLSSWIFGYHLNFSSICRKIVDLKYRTHPNFLGCPDFHSSPFWKGVLLAAKAAQMGVTWKIGNGKRVRFWEDHWIGNFSLAIYAINIGLCILLMNSTTRL